MGKATDRQTYIHNLAGTIIGTDCICPRRGAKELFSWYSGMVSQKLEKFSDQTLGKIAACGEQASANNTSLSEVRDGKPISLSIGGRSVLLEIAVTAVIAAMMDIIRARARRG